MKKTIIKEHLLTEACANALPLNLDALCDAMSAHISGHKNGEVLSDTCARIIKAYLKSVETRDKKRPPGKPSGPST